LQESHLVKNRESNPKLIFHVLLDHRTNVRLLTPELVAREAKDNEALVSELLVSLLNLLVILFIKVELALFVNNLNKITLRTPITWHAHEERPIPTTSQKIRKIQNMAWAREHLRICF
jgi:hypothetical protein